MERFSIIDGKDSVKFPVTMDYLVNRVNFVVARGFVINVSRG